MVVGSAGRPHGVAGETSVRVRTDAPLLRFAAGSLLVAELPGGGQRTLTVAAARPHGDRLLVRFAGITDRDAAQALAGATLVATASAEEAGDDPEEFFDHQLIGASVRTRSGALLGAVRDVMHPGTQDLLVVAPAGGGADVLVPFVAAIVVAVDPVAGELTLDPPGGLFDPDGGDR